MNPDSEEQLVEQAQNGDLVSFGRLYKRYYNGMVALAFSSLGDIHLAEDTAQETFAIACRDLPKLKSKGKFVPWLAAICRNTTKAVLRNKCKRTCAEQNRRLFDNDKTNNIDVIRKIVWQLKPTYREPIVMRYYDNMSYEQIAAVLNLSIQGVNGRIIRAKRKLAKELKKNDLTGS